MMNAFFRQLEELKKIAVQERLKLKFTRAAVAIYREALKKNLPGEVVNECYKMIASAAKHEWGPLTMVDDFSVEGKFVISSGQRKMEL